MTSKYIFFSLALVVLLGLLFAAYSFGKRSIPPVATENITNNTYKTTLPVETRIIRESVPAIIETLVVNNEPHGIASYSETIVRDKTTVDLSIKYDISSSLFDVNANIYSVRDSVYVETTKTIDRVFKPKLLGFTASVGAGLDFPSQNEQYNISYGDVSAGLKIAGKYSVQSFVAIQDSKKPVYGLRLGIDF